MLSSLLSIFFEKNKEITGSRFRDYLFGQLACLLSLKTERSSDRLH